MDIFIFFPKLKLPLIQFIFQDEMNKTFPGWADVFWKVKNFQGLVNIRMKVGRLPQLRIDCPFWQVYIHISINKDY